MIFFITKCALVIVLTYLHTFIYNIMGAYVIVILCGCETLALILVRTL